MESRVQRDSPGQAILSGRDIYPPSTRMGADLCGAIVFPNRNRGGEFTTPLLEGRNIGDPLVLRDVAEAAGVPEGRTGMAWSDATYEERLNRDREAAAQIGITGIPFFILDGRWILEGAVPVEMLREAAKQIASGKS